MKHDKESFRELYAENQARVEATSGRTDPITAPTITLVEVDPDPSAPSNAAGLYGDLQGIVGASLPEVEGLALPSPDVPGEGHNGKQTALSRSLPE